MFVTKKTLYKELCKVMDVINDYADFLTKFHDKYIDTKLDLTSDMEQLEDRIDDLKESYDYDIYKLFQRVEALEAKKQAKKPTKKAKGK